MICCKSLSMNWILLHWEPSSFRKGCGTLPHGSESVGDPSFRLPHATPVAAPGGGAENGLPKESRVSQLRLPQTTYTTRGGVKARSCCCSVPMTRLKHLVERLSA